MGILLTIAYDGTDYCGWQFQENGVSVFEVLGRAIEEIAGQALAQKRCQNQRHRNDGCDDGFLQGFSLMGASRTDAGVHASGQKAHLIFEEPLKESFKVPLEKLPQVLNSVLPKDISVVETCEVPDSFHPIWDAKSKTYSYKIYNHSYRNPLLQRFSAFVPTPLDIKKMQEACRHFVGEHDFAAFCAAGGSAKTTVRTINDLTVNGISGRAMHAPTDGASHVIEIIINGNGFLYNMVRIIAGTLVFVGLGKISPDDIPEIILSKDRTKAGKTMPAEGLTLLEVFY